LAGLVAGVLAMAAGAGADLAGLHGHPDALAHHRFAVRIDGLPAQGAIGRDERGGRAVGRDPDAAGRAAAVGQVGRDAHRLRHGPAPADVVAVAAHQVGLHDLVVGDVVDATVAAGLAHPAGHLQVERLLGVAAIAAGLVAGDDQGELIAAQPV